MTPLTSSSKSSDLIPLINDTTNRPSKKQIMSKLEKQLTELT